jgi:CheY-like chemotaxis protein
MSLNILIVEDDLASLELLTEILLSLNAGVRSISDGAEALRVITSERFDGIFLDLNLPHVNGLEIARHIRKSHWNRSTPIVVLTARDDRKAMEDAFAVGSTFFLRKPVERQKVVRLFRAVQGSMTAQRRRFIRVSLDTEVVCDAGNKRIKGLCRNISVGGMLFEPHGSQLPLGSSVRLLFRLPSQSRDMLLLGSVVRIDDQRRLGICFKNLDVSAGLAINQLIDGTDFK